jgi:hypothetical protein
LEYRTPDMVGVIHTTSEIADHFTGKRAQRYLRKIDVMVSTCIHPDVTKALKQYGSPAKVHWFNSSIPDLFKKNLDMFMTNMTTTRNDKGEVLNGVRTMDTGGNVGIFLCVLAEMMGFETVGLLGMEQALELNPKWTNKEAMEENVIYYAPEDFPEPFAMNQVFRGYFLTILNWYNAVRGHMRVVNLTKKGFLYIGRRENGMEYMELEKYIEEFQ